MSRETVVESAKGFLMRNLEDLNDEIQVKIDEELAKQTTSEVIASSFKIFGSVFGGIFVLFLFLRVKFPLVYTYNHVTPEYKTPLSANTHGFFKWMYKIFQHTDDEIFENCGMTAIVYLRFLRIGVKLACVGIFNSFFLFPVNMYGCSDRAFVNETWTNEQKIANGLDACTTLVDRINKVSVGNVSANNHRLLATTLAAYFIFGSAIALIFKEFKWFTAMRHKVLVKRRPDNYTVYVSHIPKEYRSDVALLEYFRSIFTHDDVIEAKIAVDTHNLEKKIAKRLDVVGKLEHAINVKKVKDFDPQHINLKGKLVQSIPSYAKDLRRLNNKISKIIQEIIDAKSIEKKKFLRDMVLANDIEASFNGLQADRTSHILNRGPLGTFYHGPGLRQLDVLRDKDDDMTEGIPTISSNREAEKVNGKSLGEEITPVQIDFDTMPRLRSHKSLDSILSREHLLDQPTTEAATSFDEGKTKLDSEPLHSFQNESQRSLLSDYVPIVNNSHGLDQNDGMMESDLLSLSDEEVNIITEVNNHVDASHPENTDGSNISSEKNKLTNIRRRSFAFGPFSTRFSSSHETIGSDPQIRSSRWADLPDRVSSSQNVFITNPHKRSLTFESVSHSIGQVTTKTVDSAKKVGTIMGKGGRAVTENVFKAGHHLADGIQIVGKGLHIGGKYVGQRASNTIKDIAIGGAYYATKAQKRVTKLLTNSPDGTVLDSGFVTFSNLSTKNQCVQMLHHATPFTFVVKHAPLPKDIFWKNVGMPHNEQQVGFLIAQALTVGFFVVITVPVTFFTSLSETDNLQEIIPALEKAILKNPWLPQFLAQLSPVLLVALTALLPFILKYISRYEGHVATTDLNASLLAKLSVFMIVQVFFVQALSGSIFRQLELIIKKPSAIMNLLATAVPSQVKSFIQFVLIQNFLGCSVELLRVIPISLAIGHNRLAPTLTEKEKRTPYLFLRPLTYPDEIEYPLLFSEMILYFMVTLIYSCVAPIMPYFILITFGILSLVFRHQLIYTYSPENDDGGKLWSKVIMLLIICLFLSEFTLTGILSLKQGVLAATAMIPLIVISGLSFLYIIQQHFRVTEFIPSTLSKKYDIRYYGKDNSFLIDQYLQPSLKEKTLYPENFTEEMRRHYLEDIPNESGHSRDEGSILWNSSRDSLIDTNKSGSLFDSQRLILFDEIGQSVDTEHKIDTIQEADASMETDNDYNSGDKQETTQPSRHNLSGTF